MSKILDEICELFPECTPELLREQLAKIPADIKLYRLNERASPEEIEANLAKLRAPKDPH